MMELAAGHYEDSEEFRAALAAIGGALAAGRASNRHDPRTVREAVRACAIHARDNGCPPEKLVRALKAVVSEVARDDATDAYRILYTDRVIGWAIESFYELTER